jgi:signal transduction histidine kinase
MRGRPRILIVDDDQKSRQLLTLALGEQGYETVTARTGQEALERAGQARIDIALLDIKLPDLLGVDLLSPLSEIQPHMAKVMITAYASTETAMQALNQGASAYITKPLRVKAILATVREILEKQRQAEERRRMVENLRQYAAELEARNEELDAFAHTVAHDLKAPANKIIGYAEMLLDEEHGPLPEEVRRECLKIMAQGARQVSTLVDELLLLAQVRSEEVQLTPLDMKAIVDGAAHRLSFMIRKRRAELILPDAWPTALGYGPWVEEVWVNYISNAVKYGGSVDDEVPPRIELGFDTEPGEDESLTRLRIRFWVRDNGLGLTPKEQEGLFTPFTRLEQVETKGHGLGLSVVRRIVEKLGGEVGVESQKGRGSVFSFTLPGVAGESPRR